MHVRVNICEDTGEAAGPYCPNVVSKVFLVKDESVTQSDAYGKTVKRHYHTADTPYILTHKAQTKCSVHLSPRAVTPPAVNPGRAEGGSDDGAQG